MRRGIKCGKTRGRRGAARRGVLGRAAAGRPPARAPPAPVGRQGRCRRGASSQLSVQRIGSWRSRSPPPGPSSCRAARRPGRPRRPCGAGPCRPPWWPRPWMRRRPQLRSLVPGGAGRSAAAGPAHSGPPIASGQPAGPAGNVGEPAGLSSLLPHFQSKTAYCPNVPRPAQSSERPRQRYGYWRWGACSWAHISATSRQRRRPQPFACSACLSIPAWALLLLGVYTQACKVATMSQAGILYGWQSCFNGACAGVVIKRCCLCLWEGWLEACLMAHEERGPKIHGGLL